MTPNLLLICLDSWRHDAVSSAPNRLPRRATFPFRLRTPTLDGLARHGTTFHQLIVQAPFTPASHASFFTGTNPPTHGIRAFFDNTLSDGVTTIAERLQAAGYDTGAIIGADALNERYRLNRGFAHYDTQFAEKIAVWKDGMHRRVGSEATDRALAWLGHSQRPFFLFVHYFDAHLIATHIHKREDRLARFLRQQRKNRRWRRQGRAVFGKLDRMYASYTRSGLAFHVRQINRLDGEIGRIVAHLNQTSQFDNTVVVIMSDHGDAFGEHGETGHRQYLYDTTLRVPLIIRPTQPPAQRVVNSVVRAIDVAPTAYDLLGISPPDDTPIEGASLQPLMQGQPDRAERLAYSETRMEKSLAEMDQLRSRLVALRDGRWKVIVNLLDGSERLFDLHSDPDERVDLSAVQPERAARMVQQALARYGVVPREADSAESAVTPAERSAIEQRLRDLGYFE